MRASTRIVSGSFFGAEIEPGTFHRNAEGGGGGRQGEYATETTATSSRSESHRAAAEGLVIKPE